MKLIHGRVVDALWRTDRSDIYVPPATAAPVWGLEILDRCLGTPERGHVVLITGNRRSGTSSLVRSIALANAQLGLHVGFYSTEHDQDAEEETKYLVSAAIGIDVVSGENVGDEPKYGSFIPISHIPGCIRVFGARPAVLPHETMEYIPDVLVCDEIDNYLGISEETTNRGIVLEALRDFARRNRCLVVAVSKDYDDDFNVDYSYMAEPWQLHADTHLALFHDRHAEPEEMIAGQVEVQVVKHRGRWYGASLYLADQRSIGRLGDVEDERAEEELLRILNRENPLAEEGQTPEIQDEVFQAAISSQIRKYFVAEPSRFLRKFGLSNAFNLQGEDVATLRMNVTRVDWALSPIIQPTLDVGDGVEWTFTTSVEADITVSGQRLSITTELYGEVVAWMTGRGLVTSVDVTGLLVPWTQQV